MTDSLEWERARLRGIIELLVVALVGSSVTLAAAFLASPGGPWLWLAITFTVQAVANVAVVVRSWRRMSKLRRRPVLDCTCWEGFCFDNIDLTEPCLMCVKLPDGEPCPANRVRRG